MAKDYREADLQRTIHKVREAADALNGTPSEFGDLVEDLDRLAARLRARLRAVVRSG